jgi:hypothetical protein
MDDRVKCKECNALILPAMAEHYGYCIPCQILIGMQDAPMQSDPIVILVPYDEVTFAMPAPEFLKQLEKTKHTGGADHPNRLELEAQRALIRHAIENKLNRRLNDDLWHETSGAAAQLFEMGVGLLLTPDQAFKFSDLKKKKWTEGTEPLMQRGGFLYKTSDGTEIYSRLTWMS